MGYSLKPTVSPNWIINNNSQTGTNGWATYNNGSVSVPTTGTGGSVTNLTLSNTTTNPQSDGASFQIVKSAANIQGEGVSYAFTIDRADLGRIQQIQTTLEVISVAGSTTAGGNIALGYITCYIYDITNGVIIQPVAYQFPSASIGTNPLEYTYVGTFQTAVNSSSYRLIFHFPNTDATALTLNFCNVYVGPQQISYGSPDTNRVAYTPTTQGFGTITANNSEWQRIADAIHIWGQFTPGTTTAALAEFGLPAGLTIDSTKVTAITQVGLCTQAGSTNAIPVTATGGNTFLQFSAAPTSWSTPANGSTVFLSSGGVLSFYAVVPVLGWSSAVLMSQPDATRTVAASYYVSSSQTASTTSQINFDTMIYDTHAAVTTTTAGSSGVWKFTCPVAGFYDILAYLQYGSTPTTFLYKNGSIFIPASPATSAGSANIQILLNAGDFIDIRPNASASANGGTLTAGGGPCIIYIHRVAGPERIAASEQVLADYYNNGGGSTGTGFATVTSGWTKVTDTHGAFSSGVFTAPRAGFLDIQVSLQPSTFAMNIQVLQAGSTSRTVYSVNITGGYVCQLLKTLAVQAGDTLTIQCHTSSSDTLAAGNSCQASFTMR